MRTTEPVPREPGPILLGTVALEPNRWGALSPDRKPTLTTEDWLSGAREAGFDGIELWEHHAMLASEAEVEALRTSSVPIEIWNSYVSFDDPEDAARDAVAGWVERLGCAAVKFNVGNDRENPVAAYAPRLERFANALPDATRLICECHMATAADDPSVAQKILSQAGGAERLQALIHLGDEPEYLDSMFAALGDRITHVHVNFLRQGAPLLSTIAEDLRERINRIQSHGFAGSYTIEFVHGLGTETDRPADLLKAAVRDLSVLREAIG
jgi:sugar phosphate isomerase/epimerase